MRMRRPSDIEYRLQYRTRVLAGVAASLALMILALHAWPAPTERDARTLTFDTRGQEVIAVDEILPTAQSQQAPPPPAPLPPIAVPDETVLEEDVLDLDQPLAVTNSTGTTGSAPPGPQGPPGPRTHEPVAAEEAPKTVRFVEPEYTREAQRRKIRAEVVVEVLVDEQGRVRERRIVERFLLGREPGEKRPVDEVGFGLEEAALSAAERWLFRPARKDGKPVRSYTTLTFTFGV